MRLLLCLAATVALCQSARIPRGAHDPFPNFHTVHHGHGATSYQNVQMESYGSVRIPTEDHNDHHQHQHHHEVDHQIVYEHEVPNHTHQQDIDYVHSANEAAENHENHQQYITLDQSDHQVSPTDGSHENIQHYILQQVPHGDNEIHHSYELHAVSQPNFYEESYELNHADDGYH